MGNLNPSFILDIVIIVFLIIMMLVGYFRGFTTRFISFVLTILSFFLAYILSKPISVLFTFKIHAPTEAVTDLLKTFYPVIYQVVAFVVLLIIFLILKTILLLIFRSTIKRLIDALSFSRFVDGILGSALSMIEGLILTFAVLCVMATPIVKKGNETIANSTVGNHIYHLVPEVSKQLNAFNETYNLTKGLDFSSLSLDKLDKNTVSTFKTMVKSAQDVGWLSAEDVTKVCESYKEDLKKAEAVTVDAQTKQEIDELLNIQGVPQDIKDLVKEKIKVE